MLITGVNKVKIIWFYFFAMKCVECVNRRDFAALVFRFNNDTIYWFVSIKSKLKVTKNIDVKYK